MTSAAFQDTLRIGRDPNDASWLIVRYDADWGKAALDHLVYDRERGVLELEPALPANHHADSWLPLEPVDDQQGNQYRADPREHRILYKAVCEEDFMPLNNIGGQGWMTGRFNRPLGLSIDHRGWLLVADADNHRVQIIRPENGSVIAVLGEVDDAGRPLRAAANGAMMEPVHAVVHPCNCHVFVADRAAGLIHEFDQRFQYLASFAPRTLEPRNLTPRPAEQQAMPLAVAIHEDGQLLVLDAGRPVLLHMTLQGDPLPAVAMNSIGNPFQGGKALPARFYAEGGAIIGPLDSGRYDMPWHRLLLDAELAEGSGISIQSYASNQHTDDPLTMPWAPAKPHAIPLAGTDRQSGEFQRPVMSDTQSWRRYRHGAYQRLQPQIHAFQGDGPVSTGQFQLSAETAARLRQGDTLRFDNGLATEALPIKHIDAHAALFTASGVARIYSTGAQLRLLSRDDAPLPGAPRLLYELAAGESVDLSSSLTDGTLQQADFIHGVVAFFRPGDVFELSQGGDAMALVIERVDAVDVSIELDAPLLGDHASSRLSLSETPGRLLIDDLQGFEIHPLLHEPVRVIGQQAEETANILLLEAHHQALWIEPGTLGPLVGFADWLELFCGEDRASDRGRYIWLRLVLTGSRAIRNANQVSLTPALRAIRVLMPRLSYLSYLPATYSRRDPRNDPAGALFLERFLALFENKLTQMETAYESVCRLLNPELADEEWLHYVAAWSGLVFDPSWPIEGRRQLVLEAADLYKRRGTLGGMQRFVEIYTGRRPQLLEGFQWRPSSALIVGRSGRLGCSMLAGQSCDYRRYAHRFTIFVFLENACDQQHLEPSLRNIVDALKPAHVDYTLCFVLPHARVGMQSRVGVDTVLGDMEPPQFHLGQGRAPLATRTHPVIGLDRVPASDSPTVAPRAARLGHGRLRCDHGLTLK